MEEIIALLEKRDESALLYMKKQYGNYCYTIIYGILRDHEEAQEALNDVWLRIWQSIPPGKPDCFRAYLAKVCRNIALDRLKYCHAGKRIQETLPLDEIREMLPDPGWERKENGRELKEVLNAFLKTLKPEERKLFIRRYWYNETIEELSEAFYCSQSRITGILFRVRKRLRKYLEREGYSYE